MTSEVLTTQQMDFIEECNREFANRYTDDDPDYKAIYDAGVPPPPIVCPWYTRSRFNNRDRAGGSRYNRDRRDYRPDNRAYRRDDYDHSEPRYNKRHNNY